MAFDELRCIYGTRPHRCSEQAGKRVDNRRDRTLRISIPPIRRLRSLARRTQEAARSSKEQPPVSWAPEWQRLADRFEACSRFVRADWSTSERATTWRLAGGYDESKPIESLCIFAGALLLKSPNVYAAVNDEVRNETEALRRWLTFIKSINVSDSVNYGTQQDDAGNSLGVLVFDSYSGIAHTSALLCTKCAAQEL